MSQTTWGVGGPYATHYPVKWTLDVTARRVVDAADAAEADPALVSVQADDMVPDAALDAGAGCAGVECRVPD